MTIYNKRMSSAYRLRRASRRAFTMVEMMFTVVLLALALASIVPTFGFFAKSIAGLGNYSTMSSDSRNALEIIARDLHTAETLTAGSANSLTLVLPSELDSAAVVYTYDSTAKTLTRTHTPSGSATTSDVLFDDVELFNFVFYNRLGTQLTTASQIAVEGKSVQVNAKMVKKAIKTDNTDYIISARFLMRNI